LWQVFSQYATYREYGIVFRWQRDVDLRAFI
jgi:hypothetical protein